jgi:hypothetical protein
LCAGVIGYFAGFAGEKMRRGKRERGKGRKEEATQRFLLPSKVAINFSSLYK